MNQIWKYRLSPQDTQPINMPLGAVLLAVAMQRDEICIWAEVNPESQLSPRIIEVFGTGHKMDVHERKYIGTVLACNDALVFHIFERLP